jgi:hypothetical protein
MWTFKNTLSTEEYVSKMNQATGIEPSYCGQCSSTCRGCLKEQIPNHRINKMSIHEDIKE